MDSWASCFRSQQKTLGNEILWESPLKDKFCSLNLRRRPALRRGLKSEKYLQVEGVSSSQTTNTSGQPPPPPSYGRIKLSPSDKPYFNALHDAAYKQGKNMWFKIGISLNIMSVFDLDSIRKNNPSDVGECFSAMLQKWFQSSPDCHLDTFLKALRSEPVELENLCPKVEEAILKIAFPDQKNLGTASDVGGVDLQELMDKYHVDTVQLDQVIPGNELPVIATYFDSVKLYSAAMGLSAAEQHDVRTTFLQYDTQTAMVRCLRLWKQYRPSMATYRALMELLLKLNRTEVAAQVCQYLAQNVPPHESVKSNQQSEPQISTRTDLLGEDGLSDANQKGVDSYVNFWTGRDVLYVYFLNPDILEQEKWECEYGVLNIDNILSWAEAWNPK
ncbi:uncharacterized protein LOC135332887 [Halichondria panicea]|uniref:uncharacterized protein LOC135332887 n=1 Tax=Halichondria panicea TaxID=6063 RepID=UPI00312BB4AE